jgi:hypothetical protein
MNFTEWKFNRYDLLDAHQRELSETGKTVCNSPSIRYHIYRYLEYTNQAYQSDHVSFGGVIRKSRHNVYAYGTKTVMSKLMNGKYTCDSFYSQFFWLEAAQVLDSLFDPTINREIKYLFVREICTHARITGKYSDPIPDLKQIKQITLI